MFGRESEICFSSQNVHKTEPAQRQCVRVARETGEGPGGPHPAHSRPPWQQPGKAVRGRLQTADTGDHHQFH